MILCLPTFALLRVPTVILCSSFSRGKRRPQRYYVGKEFLEREVAGAKDITGGFDAEMPSEWESWLRHRREDPPTNEQV